MLKFVPVRNVPIGRGGTYSSWRLPADLNARGVMGCETPMLKGCWSSAKLPESVCVSHPSNSSIRNSSMHPSQLTLFLLHDVGCG